MAFNKTIRAICVFVAAALPALGNIVIVPTYDATITGDPNASAIEGSISSALNAFENSIASNISVSIKFQEVTTGLGSNSTYYSPISYAQYRSLLSAGATSADDATALAHLPNTANNPVNGTAYINVKTANLRALGLNWNPPGGFDGTVSLNTSLTTPGKAGTTGQYNLADVVEHEVDEVLGLGSALPGLSNGNPFPEDLYRYDSSGARSFTTTSTAKAFFSINATTDLAQFDNQNDGGDFGDWQSNPLPVGVSPQVQDAFSAMHANPGLGVELTALDVIGYTLATQPTATPEPASGILFASALGILAGFMRLRAKRAAVSNPRP